MSGRPINVAVLMTCHNRRDLTLRCLEALFEAERQHHAEAEKSGRPITLSVFLVDDGSTDGTAQAVAERYPDVTVIPGGGDLYWGGGMRLARRNAIDGVRDLDELLWLNDDTRLLPDALSRLVEARAQRPGAVIVGVTGSPDEPGRATYGGLRRVGWLLPYYRLIGSRERPVACDTINGNIVLVPADIDERLGGIDPAFLHRRGDFDFGLRARQAGVDVIQAPGVAGVCPANPPEAGVWLDWRRPLSARLAALRGPKYAMAEKIRFARRHHGWLWFLSPAMTYAYVWLTAPLPAWLWRLMRRSA